MLSEGDDIIIILASNCFPQLNHLSYKLSCCTSCSSLNITETTSACVCMHSLVTDTWFSVGKPSVNCNTNKMDDHHLVV